MSFALCPPSRTQCRELVSVHPLNREDLVRKGKASEAPGDSGTQVSQVTWDALRTSQQDLDTAAWSRIMK
jgi:hypothetical protein